MSIIRVVKEKNPFVQIDKTPLEDPEISFKAKGLLSYMLTKPDNWKIRISDLAKHATDGEKSIYAGIKELRQHGYCQLIITRDKRGRIIEQEYHIYEKPNKNIVSLSNTEPDPQNGKVDKNQIKPDPQNGKVDKNQIKPDPQNGKVDKNQTEPVCQKRHAAKRDAENRHYSNNNCSNNNFTNNECEGEPSRTQSFFDQKIKEENSELKTIQKTSKKENLSPKKVAPKKNFNTSTQLSFEQSSFNDFEEFKPFLEELDYGNLDINHYYTKIKLNAQSKGLKLANWQAYIQKWLYEDKLANKLIWAKTQAASQNVQKEISQNIKQITQDLEASIFTTQEALNSILERSRMLWKESNDTNRIQLEALAEKVKKKQKELLLNPKTPQQNPVKAQKKPPFQNKLKDRLRSIKPIDDSS